MSKETDVIRGLCLRYKGKEPDSIESLPESGSYRKYFRIRYKKEKIIGVYNEDRKENIAFLSFTRHFIKQGLHVPEIFLDDSERNGYLLRDLGDVTLLKYISGYEEDINFTEEVLEMYKKVVEHLPLFQVKGGMNADYSVCYPRSAFDKQSMMWDLNYFKYYFLRLARIPFDEQKLEDDFQNFSDFLLQADSNFFLYRDFQSRNIMIVDNEPFFIDYQGGRRGALQYDIASLLFEAKTSLPGEIRQILLDHYLKTLSKYVPVDVQKFLKYYYGFVYIRLMQAMGAYGFRGLYEKKTLFLQSIPKALKHLSWLRSEIKLLIELPELENVWDRLIASENTNYLPDGITSLSVAINSFSYHHEMPGDNSNNGGGYVFDCRLLENPGKLEEYKKMTGLDKPVIEFLENRTEVNRFLDHVYAIIDSSIDSYKKKGYSNLMVNFGCTGGQHRSVYCAEKLSNYLKNKFPGITIEIKHTELNRIV
jgi:aminoglycoside/choline kinase family phosphotransferase